MSEVAKDASGVLPRMGKLGAEDWERMRSEISGLYPKTTLNEMKEVIQQLHGFTARFETHNSRRSCLDKLQQAPSLRT